MNNLEASPQYPYSACYQLYYPVVVKSIPLPAILFAVAQLMPFIRIDINTPVLYLCICTGAVSVV